MRKVFFQYWIFAETKFSEVQSGYFHCWGYETHEDAVTIVMESVALVEHATTGHMHKVDPSKLQFVQPPETKTHSKDSAKVEIVNIESLGKRTLDVLIPVLESINKKLDSI